MRCEICGYRKRSENHNCGGRTRTANGKRNARKEWRVKDWERTMAAPGNCKSSFQYHRPGSNKK